MTITVQCARCRKEFDPDPRMIAAGAWRLCPACRAESPFKKGDTPWIAINPLDQKSPCRGNARPARNDPGNDAGSQR